MSATLLLLREASGRLEVLMQRRAPTLSFGGTWVFPGGGVDPVDGDVQLELAAVLRRAVVRECFEEAGVSFAGLDLARCLVGWSRWITPAGRQRRFDTWFFVAALPQGQAAVGDAVEAVESEWLEPAVAIAARHSGAMPMMPPALLSLIDLQDAYARHGSLQRLLDAEAARPTPPILPRLTQTAGLWEAVYPWDSAYPALQGEGIELDTVAPEHLLRLPSRIRLPVDYVSGLLGDPVGPEAERR